MRYDAVVFDNDGVLTTPTDLAALRSANRTAFETVDVVDPAPAHVDTLLSPTVDALRGIAEEYDIDAERLWTAREQAAIEVQAEELRAGRKTLYDDVATIHTLERPCAIVSNNQHETIANILEHFDLGGFDPWYGREPTVEGLERKKPTPYYLERVLEELAAEDPLYVGDSRVDVAAASACGIDCAFVRRPHRDGYDLPEVPTHEIDSLEALASLV